MGRLDGFSPREVGRVVERHGWRRDHATGSPIIYRHPEFPENISLPDHDPVRIGLLRAIIRTMRISTDEFPRSARK